MNHPDEEYLQIVLDAIRVCARHKPKFGQRARGGGLTFEGFRELYRKDAFYSWFGLDNPLMYSAHKAAGGMTSVYRQIGIGCEKLFRRVLRDALDQEPRQVRPARSNDRSGDSGWESEPLDSRTLARSREVMNAVGGVP